MSDRTRYAEEIQRRIVALALPTIGSNVFVRQFDRPGPTEIKPCVEVRRGPQTDKESTLNSGVKFPSYYYQIQIKDGTDNQEGSDDLDGWYELIEQEFHGKDWPQDTFPEVVGCIANPSEPQVQKPEEYQLFVNGLTIIITFHKPR